jgi:hypothetical protein
MSYYKGDFYQGDFYQGDPGFFSFLGKVAKGIGSVATSFFPGGSVVGKVGSAIQKVSAHPIVQRVGGAIVRHPVLSAAGAAGVVGAGGSMVGRRGGRMGAAGVGPAGVPRRMGGAGMGRRHRRMHVTNVKALRRAIRRAKGFERLARRVMHFTSPRPPRGRAVFKVRRKKRI